VGERPGCLARGTATGEETGDPEYPLTTLLGTHSVLVPHGIHLLLMWELDDQGFFYSFVRVIARIYGFEFFLDSFAHFNRFSSK
jgi:hypothetical protein